MEASIRCCGSARRGFWFWRRHSRRDRLQDLPPLGRQAHQQLVGGDSYRLTREIYFKAKPRLVVGEPLRTNGALTATLAGHEAIPDLLEVLVHHNVRVYRIAAQEANLEQVYFALHGEKESVQ